MTDLEKMIKKVKNEAEANWEYISDEDAKKEAEARLEKLKNAPKKPTATPSAKPKKPHPVKISDEKKALFDTILTNLDRCVGVERENIEILKENKLIQVKIGTKTFKIDITETRPPKKK